MQVQNALRMAETGPEVADLYHTQAAAPAGPYALLPSHSSGGGAGSGSDSEYRQGGGGGSGGGAAGLGGNVPGRCSHAAQSMGTADEDTQKLLSVIWNLLIPRGGM